MKHIFFTKKKLFFCKNFFLVIFFLLYGFEILAQKKVVVTGGAGFIGSHVVEKLLQRGDFVIIIDNFADSQHQYSDQYSLLKRFHLADLQIKYPHELTIYEIDITDKDALDEIFAHEQPEQVCHLAALAGVRGSIEAPDLYISTNILGSVNIFEMAKKYGIDHLVVASSSSVYGNCAKGPFTEDQITDRQNSPYGMSKKSQELLAYVYHHLYGISVNCLRFFTVYGPYGRFDMSPFIFIDAIHNEKPIRVFGDGSFERDFTYIDDIVRAILSALDTSLGFQIFNVGSSNPVTINQFITFIEEIVGKKATIIYEEHFSADVPLTYANIVKAEELLNYKPQMTLKEGIANTYDWYCQTYLPLK